MRGDKEPLGYKILLYPNKETPDDKAEVAVRGSYTECMEWIEDIMFMPSEKRRKATEKYRGGYRIISFPISRISGIFNPSPTYASPKDRA